jgi:hypothetical protein
LRKRLPVSDVTRAFSDINAAELAAGWKFKKVFGGAGFEEKRLGITNSNKKNVRGKRLFGS